MSLFATVLPLAEIEDFIGIIFFILFGLISYCAEYLKRQKKEAAARRALQKDFRARADKTITPPPPLRTPSVSAKAVMPARTHERKSVVTKSKANVELEAYRRMQSRAEKNPIVSCMRPQDNIELSMSDAELAALEALQSGRGLKPTAPIAGRKQLLASATGSTSSVKLNANTLRQAIIYKEILDRPRSLREYSWK